MASNQLSCVILVGIYLVAAVTSERILFLMPLATKSETLLLNPLARELLQRGHKVTFVSPVSSNLKHNNLTEIIPVKPLELADFDSGDNLFEMRKRKDDIRALLYVDMSYMTSRCHETYQHKDFQTVLQADSYDLVLTSAFFSECFLGLIHKLRAPFIQLASMPLPKHSLDVTGLRTPLSFVPNPFIDVTDSMSLSERLVNTLSSWSFSFLNYYHYFKISEQIYKQYLGDDLPDVDVLRANVSMIFSNTHYSINYPRPLLPDVVEIGGVHCRPPKPLPKELEIFVAGNKNGFIFFSMGTVFRDEVLPKHVKQMFINVFSRLKLRVLWKWQTEKMEGLPNNVKLSKWLPQQDILGHPNIKLFISHGGLLSTIESTFHGVPLLGIPLFVDQDANMKAAEAHGYAMKLELLDLTEDILETSINRMLNESSFAEHANLASRLLKDQPQAPLERGVYWMEYLIKYKGAPQLRSSARNLTYFQYHLYDVQLILLAVASTIIIIAWKIISCILCFGKDDETPKMKLSKKYR